MGLESPSPGRSRRGARLRSLLPSVSHACPSCRTPRRRPQGNVARWRTRSRTRETPMGPVVRCARRSVLRVSGGPSRRVPLRPRPAMGEETCRSPPGVRCPLGPPGRDRVLSRGSAALGRVGRCVREEAGGPGRRRQTRWPLVATRAFTGSPRPSAGHDGPRWAGWRAPRDTGS